MNIDCIAIIFIIVLLYILNNYIRKYNIDRFENVVKTYDEYEQERTRTLNEISLNEKSKVFKQGLDKNYDTITDQIDDVYLPYVDTGINTEINKNINEYTIINTYKQTLNRQPSSIELKKLLAEFKDEKLDDNLLKTRLYNSPEYKMNVKMQSNDTDPGLISTVSSINMIDKLKKMYKTELKKDIESKMISPLKDCYIHLQYNDYLFIAMLRDERYRDFEREVLETHMLSREKMLDLFNKYFLLADLRIEGNKKKREELLSMKGDNVVVPENILKDNKTGLSVKESNNNLGADKQISKIVKDGNNIFNINILLSDDIKNGNNSTPYSNDNSYTDGDIINGKKTQRIYNPLKYKQQYRGDMRYRPNVCSYGTPQVVQPLYFKSYGTDLKDASENTQVGSIMPKFEYREYEDVPIEDVKKIMK